MVNLQTRDSKSIIDISDYYIVYYENFRALFCRIEINFKKFILNYSVTYGKKYVKAMFT